MVIVSVNIYTWFNNPSKIFLMFCLSAFHCQSLQTYHFLFLFSRQLVVGITTACFGILFVDFLNEEGASSTMVGWIYSLAFVFSSFFCYFLDPAVTEFGYRTIALFLGLMNSLGLAMSAFATSSTFLFFSYSLVAGNSSFQHVHGVHWCALIQLRNGSRWGNQTGIAFQVVSFGALFWLHCHQAILCI